VHRAVANGARDDYARLISKTQTRAWADPVWADFVSVLP
jgi:hypothetical protein